MRTPVAALVALSLLAAVGMVGAEPRDAAPKGYAVLDDKATQLREDFNKAKGSVRLLFVVDPVCPGCLRGLDDVNRDLLSQIDDPKMQTFVVHVPVIGAKARDVLPAGMLLKNQHVRHYWNPTGEFGKTLANALQLKHGKETVYAWDVWLVYGPEVEWNDVAPPPPQLFMHQLWKLEGTKFASLDSKEFGRYAKELLAKRTKE
jgi:hypothetical protein